MNEDQLKFIQNHQAIWQQQGFDYQFAVYLYYLISGDLHDSITYEDVDDIVVEYQNGETNLIQVKHSYNGGKITNSSDDIWKTLDNWHEWIYTHNAGGKDVKKLELTIITNKEVSNDLLNTIAAIKIGDAGTDALKKVLVDLSNLKSAQNICNKLLSHPDRILPLLMKISTIKIENPYQVIYEKLLLRSPKGYSIDNAFEEIVGRMTQKKEQLQPNHKMSLTVEEFNYLCEDIFQNLMISPMTPIEPESKSIPQDYLSTNMVKQLLSIDLIKEDDPNDAELLHAYYNYWCYENSLDMWFVQNHYLTEYTIQKLNEKFKFDWRLILNRSFRKCDDSESSIKECGYTCYTDTMNKEIKLNGLTIPVPFSSGWYLNLSNEDIPSVYWRKDWGQYNASK